MARVHYVKKAQQRYKTVPVIDPSTGEQKKVPVMKKIKDYETGEVVQVPKTTKTGREVFRKITMEDKSQPLPNRHCDKCNAELKVGEPYKWVAIKTSTYGSTTKFRCGSCPSWQPWELSNSRSAQIQRILADADVSSCESKDDIDSVLQAAADEIRQIAEEVRESASNIEDGFGHSTEMSEDLNQQGDDLEAWADEMDQGVEEVDAEPCSKHEENIGDPNYSGDIEEDCVDCQESWDNALDEMRSAADDLLSASPL